MVAWARHSRPDPAPMDYETLLVEFHDDRVATVTINRPASLNAFNFRMMQEFADLWPRLQKNDAVNVIVLRAAEGRAFSTGADVKAAGAEAVVDYERPLEQKDPGLYLGPKSNHCWKPVIGAIHGLCCAGAFYWVAECDFCLCSDDAQFFDPHVNYALVAAVEPIELTHLRVPYGEVMRMVLMGNDERISAPTALRIGLVTEVVEGHEALWARAHELAARIALHPPMTLQGTVRMIWESMDMNRSTALVHAMRMPTFVNPLVQKNLDVAAMRKAPRKFELR